MSPSLNPEPAVILFFPVGSFTTCATGRLGRASDTDLVQILARMFGHLEPDTERHQRHERRNAEEGELERTGRLLKGSEEPV
jgi:hypothetical protein